MTLKECFQRERYIEKVKISNEAMLHRHEGEEMRIGKYHYNHWYARLFDTSLTPSPDTHKSNVVV